MASIATEQINLHWQKFSGSFKRLRSEEAFSDITLACVSQSHNGDEVALMKAHKVVLAASSPVLRRLMLNMAPNQHSILYLNNVDAEHVKSVLDYVYSGEVNVSKDSLDAFLGLARDLGVEGLVAQQRPLEESIKDESEEPVGGVKRPRIGDPLADSDSLREYSLNTEPMGPMIGLEGVNCGAKDIQGPQEEVTHQEVILKGNIY